MAAICRLTEEENRPKQPAIQVVTRLALRRVEALPRRGLMLSGAGTMGIAG
jgi:hypothetical protein